MEAGRPDAAAFVQLIEFARPPVAFAPSAAVLARADEATVVVALAG